nr:MAG TPA: hypothetical protein [Siphoviridae sp. ctewe10]
MKGIASNNNHFTGKKSFRTKAKRKRIKKKRVHVNKYSKRG